MDIAPYVEVRVIQRFNASANRIAGKGASLEISVLM
jgi:hypothetical protein